MAVSKRNGGPSAHLFLPKFGYLCLSLCYFAIDSIDVMHEFFFCRFERRQILSHVVVRQSRRNGLNLWCICSLQHIQSVTITGETGECGVLYLFPHFMYVPSIDVQWLVQRRLLFDYESGTFRHRIAVRLKGMVSNLMWLSTSGQLPVSSVVPQMHLRGHVCRHRMHVSGLMRGCGLLLLLLLSY